ncbi:MAG: lysophospholipid acyltransferase family protein [Alphaproteobacteria bacterium]|nr:lysophospholipid acyltransferase family protein [Alphaproteobacteria bacterium]
MSGLLRFCALLLLVGWIAFWLPLAAVASLFHNKKLRDRMVQIACKGLLWLFNVRVNIIGDVYSRRPLLLVSNHLSYLDIPVLGSAVDCRFVPKKEIANWPVISTICKILDVVYVDRDVRKISEGNQSIAGKLAQGEAVVLFPEATTGDGRHLLPFKPAFFQAAQGIVVQPVAIAYRKIRGLPIDFGQWPLIAWYGDMSLLPHLWTLLSLGRIEVELHFLPPIISAGKDRKILASQSHDAIERVLLDKN